MKLTHSPTSTCAVVAATLLFGGQLRGQEPRDSMPGAPESAEPFRFTLRGGGAYNRVEGLPVMMGFRFSRPGSAPFGGEAVGIWRSESAWRGDPGRWGYMVSAEQHFGRNARFTVGGSVGSVIAPIEESNLGTLEASLATLFFHDDYRDHVERRGVSAFVRYGVSPEDVVVTLEYREEDHRYAPPGSPWTVWEQGTPWRPQPLVGEGRIRTLGAHLALGALGAESAEAEDAGQGGWEMRISTTLGLGGSLVLPAHAGDPPASSDGASARIGDRPLDAGFATGTVDARRHHVLGASWEVRLRGFVSGPLDGRSVPPQFQRALGGAGALPARGVFSLDCGARSALYTLSRRVAGGPAGAHRVYSSYGCDGVALAQVEVRRRFPLHLDERGEDEAYEAWGWGRRPTLVPAASVFLDAGRGWRESDDSPPVDPTPASGALVDLGVGIFLGGAGLYWAWPLTESDGRGGKLGIRLQARF